VKTDGPYLANVTVQINNQEVTSFVNDAEQTLTSITNEEIYNPVSYHNLLPLPQAGAPVPTYAPTKNVEGSINIDLLSNTLVKPTANNNGATPSYIDNFCYGYADTVPLSAGSTPQTQPTINTGPEPATEEPFPTTILVVAILAVVVVALVGVLVYLRRGKHA
jgi:hypothetical protein